MSSDVSRLIAALRGDVPCRRRWWRAIVEENTETGEDLAVLGQLRGPEPGSFYWWGVLVAKAAREIVGAALLKTKGGGT